MYVFFWNTNSTPDQAKVLLLSLVRLKCLGSRLFVSGSDYFVTLLTPFFGSTFINNSTGHLQRYGVSINFQGKTHELSDDRHSGKATQYSCYRNDFGDEEVKRQNQC